MKYIILGGFSFLLFIIYDINNITSRQRAIKSFFGLGCLLLIYATWQLVLKGQASFLLPVSVRWIAAFFVLGFAMLLFYTLFLALPFQQTYVSIQGTTKVCNQGVYALCRHPGLLWFAGIYFFLWLYTGKSLLLFGGTVFSLLNLLYVYLQDHYIFPKQFTNYNHYQATTPFLLPNRKSLIQCFNSLLITGVLK